MKRPTSTSSITTRSIFRRVLSLLTREDRQWLLAGGLLAMVSATCSIALLAVAGHFIAAMALVGAGGAAINYYTPAALIRLLAIVRTGGRYVERLSTHAATLRLLARLRVWVFSRLIPLSPRQLQAFRSAELFSRLRADVDALEHAYLGVLVPVVVACGSAGFVLIVSACYLPAFAVALLGMLAIAGAWLPAWLRTRSEAASATIVACTEQLRLLAVDGVQGRAELALYGAQMQHAQAVEAVSSRRMAAHARLDHLQALGATGCMLAAQLSITLALALGMPALLGARLQAPDLVMLSMMAMALFETIAPLGDALTQWSSTRRSAERILALVDMQPDIADISQLVLAPLGTAVSVRKLRVRYDSAWVLKGVDLDLAPGQHVALLGASGAGKSTLVAALLRLHPYAGTILLDGKPLDAYHIGDVRACFGVVEQQPYLFDASLRDNLCLTRPSPTEEQLRHAIEVAQLSSFVAALPQGLDTLLGENGMRLSGGEIRRIAVARALLTEAPILILDEPTEGLDAHTADALLRALNTATVGRTVLLITHREHHLELLVDQVMEMKDGRIVERDVSSSMQRAS